MIVHELDRVCVTVLPDKADTPLVVDANAVLPRPVALQRLEPVARREAQSVKARRGMELRVYFGRGG